MLSGQRWRLADRQLIHRDEPFDHHVAMPFVTVRHRVLDENDLEAALRRVGGRQSDATVDEGAGQNQILDLECAQLLLEIRSQERAVGQLANEARGRRQIEAIHRIDVRCSFDHAGIVVLQHQARPRALVRLVHDTHVEHGQAGRRELGRSRLMEGVTTASCAARSGRRNIQRCISMMASACMDNPAVRFRAPCRPRRRARPRL